MGSKAGRTKASISRGVEDAAFLFLGLGATAERRARAIAVPGLRPLAAALQEQSLIRGKTHRTGTEWRQR